MRKDSEIVTLVFHNKGIKFTSKCTCNKGPQWCIHIVATLLYISKEKFMFLYEGIKRNNIQTMSRAELEILVLNSMYNAEHTFPALVGDNHIASEANSATLETINAPNHKCTIDAQISELQGLFQDALPVYKNRNKKLKYFRNKIHCCGAQPLG